jgi:hypothetical protein
MPPRKLAVLLLLCNGISLAIAFVFIRWMRPAPSEILNKGPEVPVIQGEPRPASEIKRPKETQILPEIGLNKREPVLTPPDIVLRHPSFSLPPADKGHVWMVGYAVRGRTINVWLSDGRHLTERDPELGQLHRNSVEIERHRVWMMPPVRPGVFNAAETLQASGAKGAPVGQDAGVPGVAIGG